MSVVVTGAAGFIGSSLARRLAADGTDVVGVDAMSYASDERRLAGVGDNFQLVRADIRDRDAVDALFETRSISSVFHLAAESHVDRSIDDPLGFIETNVLGTAVLLESIRCARLSDGFRFVHVSTDEVFGALGDSGKFEPSSPYDPRSPYSASKAGSDHLVRAWRHTYGLPTIVTNCSNNYGPYQFPEKLIPVTIIRAIRGEPILVYGQGRNVRDWIHVEDHCRALSMIAEHGRPGSTYLIGGNSEVANVDVVRSICDHLDLMQPRSDGRSYQEQIEFVADRPGHDWRYAIDSTAVESELGWRPEQSFEEGLGDVVRWFLNNRWWWEPLMSDRYSGRRLGFPGEARKP